MVLVSFLCCGSQKKKTFQQSATPPRDIVPENIASDRRALQMQGVCSNVVWVSKIMSEEDKLAIAQPKRKPAFHRLLNALKQNPFSFCGVKAEVRHPNNDAEHTLVSFLCCAMPKKKRRPHNTAEHLFVS